MQLGKISTPLRKLIGRQKGTSRRFQSMLLSTKSTFQLETDGSRMSLPGSGKLKGTLKGSLIWPGSSRCCSPTSLSSWTCLCGSKFSKYLWCLVSCLGSFYLCSCNRIFYTFKEKFLKICTNLLWSQSFLTYFQLWAQQRTFCMSTSKGNRTVSFFKDKMNQCGESLSTL